MFRFCAAVLSCVVFASSLNVTSKCQCMTSTDQCCRTALEKSPMEMRKTPRVGEDGILCDRFPELRIVEGNNLEELDEFLDVFVGGVV